MALKDVVKIAEERIKELDKWMDDQENVEIDMVDAFNRLLNTYRRLVQTKWMEENR